MVALSLSTVVFSAASVPAEIEEILLPYGMPGHYARLDSTRAVADTLAAMFGIRTMAQRNILTDTAGYVLLSGMHVPEGAFGSEDSLKANALSFLHTATTWTHASDVDLDQGTVQAFMSRRTVLFRQLWQGIPVLGAFAKCSYDSSTSVMTSFESTLVRGLTVSTTPAIDSEAAEELACLAIVDSSSCDSAEEAALSVLLEVDDSRDVLARLVWVCTQIVANEGAWRTVVDAQSGAIVMRESLSATATLSGTAEVRPNFYDPCQGTAFRPLRALYASIDQPQYVEVLTDETGGFAFLGLDEGSYEVTFELRGEEFSIKRGKGDPPNQPGAIPSQTVVLQADQASSFHWPVDDSDGILNGEQTTWYWIDACFEVLRDYGVQVPFLEVVIDATVDDHFRCSTAAAQGIYQSNSIILCAAGYDQSGNRLRYASSELGDLVAHEFGHFVDDHRRIPGGALLQNRCFSEGLADVFAMLMTMRLGAIGGPTLADPMLWNEGAALLTTCGQGGAYIRRFPDASRIWFPLMDYGDPTDPVPNTGSCRGDAGHVLGQVVSTFYWRILDGLQVAGGMTREEAISWGFEKLLGVYGENPLDHAQLVWLLLELDDDNGTYQDRTPHWDIIVQAAADTGIPVPPELAKEFIDVSSTTDISYAGEPTVVQHLAKFPAYLLFGFEAAEGELYERTSSQFEFAPRFANSTGSVFQSASVPAGAHSFSQSDFDNDGEYELFVAHASTPRLFEYEQPAGSNQFTSLPPLSDRASQRHLDTLANLSIAARWADVDRDGWLEMYVVRADISSSTELTPSGIDGHGAVDRLLKYDPTNGFFTDVTAEAGLHLIASETVDAAWGDPDRDGAPDLFVAWLGPAGPDNRSSYLYMNRGDGTFFDAADSNLAHPHFGRLGKIRAVQWADLNLDGYQDLLFARQDESVGPQSNLMVCYNEGAAGPGNVTLEPVYGPLATEPMTQVAVADFNTDGYWDVLGIPLTDEARAHLYLGTSTDPGVSFARAEQGGPWDLGGLTAGGVAVGDLNLDGFNDVFLGRDVGQGEPILFALQPPGISETNIRFEDPPFYVASHGVARRPSLFVAADWDETVEATT